MKKTVKLGDTPKIWDAQSLYDKAELYAERMFRSDSEDEEKLLWSALALELLARAALANVSPVLLVDVRKDGNLDFAIGLPVKGERFKPTSLKLDLVFDRLNKTLPDFIEQHKEFCVKHAGHRNAELHSGESPFEKMKNWEGPYYQAVEILLGSMGMELEDFLGGENIEAARKEIEAFVDKSAEAVKKDVADSKKTWEGLIVEERVKRLAEARTWATRHAGHRVKCPACESPAIVMGEAINAPEQSIEDQWITQTQTMLPHQFECVACGLKIAGLARLKVVDLGEKYKRRERFDAYELFAQPPETWAFADDNNEPF